MRRPPIAVSEEDRAFVRDNVWILGVAECARRTNRNVSVIYKIARAQGLTLNPLYRSNHFDVRCITSLTDPFAVYFLGYFWADGSITAAHRRRVKFKIVKRDFDAAILPHLGRLGSFWNYSEYSNPNKPQWADVSVLDVVDKGLWQFLSDHDYRVKSRASADKILAAIPEALRHYWWRGYLDGDGSVTVGRSCRIVFNSGYDQDWSFVHALGRHLDIDFTIERADRGTRKGSKADLSNQVYVRRLVEYLYQGERLGLERKRERCEALLKRTNHKPQGPGTSIYRGVSYCTRRSVFVMQVRTGETFVRKDFQDEVAAAHEYDRLAREFFGNRASLNFPNAA